MIESEEEETSKPVEDGPAVTSPTANIKATTLDRSRVAEQLSPPAKIQEAHISSARRATPSIPDAIKVLIQPGVEPEDVGIHDKIEDDL